MATFAKSGRSWMLIAAAPPREVFAVMEQMIGTDPYQFEVTGDDQARIVEVSRLGFFGNWRRAKRSRRWVTVTAQVVENGTRVDVECSKPAFRLSPRFNRAAETRALQLVQLLSRGTTDQRTIYRERRIPAGPVSLVASWAGTGYPLYTEAAWSAPRGDLIYTGTEIHATGDTTGPFVQVRTAAGATGWVERDQIVAAPAVSTREAQVETAKVG